MYCFSVHLRQEEKVVVVVGKDGGVQNFELHGLVTLRIADEKWAKIRIMLENNDTRGIQLQVSLECLLVTTRHIFKSGFEQGS